jgi:hypothetical protein
MKTSQLGAKAFLLFATLSIVQAQQAPSTKPLGDVAREEQQAKKQDKKTTAPRVYKDVGTALADETAPPESETATKPKAAVPAHRSVFDQAKSSKPDYIVIPAGTEIRVDIVEAKVIAPVRVAFATPIPPMSVAGVKVNHHYFAPVSYNLSQGDVTNANGIYSETGELTSVTVRGVTYPVQAKPVPLNGGATYGTSASIVSSRDAVFVLTAPLQIER